jgi:hypothetical protein
LTLQSVPRANSVRAGAGEQEEKSRGKTKQSRRKAENREPRTGRRDIARVYTKGKALPTGNYSKSRAFKVSANTRPAQTIANTEAFGYYRSMSNENGSSGILGKKVFFLYPSVVVVNDIVQELIQQEFEVYVAKDHGALQRVLRQFPDSIVFADIDEGISENDWELWIRGVMDSRSTKKVRIGVLSGNRDEELQKKYLTDINIACGYTVLRKNPSITIQHILEILKREEAKGRRKYLRTTMEEGASAAVNMPYNNNFIKGIIRDISTVGFSASFEEDPELAKNSLCHDVQIKLQSMLLKTEGIVFGSRMDGLHKLYVILFTQRIDPDVRSRIRRYIQQTFQAKIDILLKQSNMRQPERV